MPGDGYGYSGPELTGMIQDLHRSTHELVSSSKGLPKAPNAGSSTKHMAKVYETLLRSGAALAAKQDDVANKIHATNGSYADVANTNRGELHNVHPGGGY